MRPIDTPSPTAAGEPVRQAIMLIEDDSIQLLGLQMLLEGEGYPVITAVDAARALLKLQWAQPPDLIVSDLRLPGEMSGLETIVEIRRQTGRDMPAIILTGDTDPNRLHEVGDRNIVLLHKPFDPAVLIAMIAELLVETRAAGGSDR